MAFLGGLDTKKTSTKKQKTGTKSKKWAPKSKKTVRKNNKNEKKRRRQVIFAFFVRSDRFFGVFAVLSGCSISTFGMFLFAFDAF